MTAFRRAGEPSFPLGWMALLFVFLTLGLFSGCQSTRISGKGKDIVLDELLFVETVRASYYSERFRGRSTANGERFNPGALTAAHPSLPFGTLVLVRRKGSGRYVVVRINDRGPYISGRRIDLSEGAARALGMIHRGVVSVDLFVVPARSQLAAML